jgi:hypothetical protein
MFTVSAPFSFACAPQQSSRCVSFPVSSVSRAARGAGAERPVRSQAACCAMQEPTEQSAFNKLVPQDIHENSDGQFVEPRSARNASKASQTPPSIPRCEAARARTPGKPAIVAPRPRSTVRPNHSLKLTRYGMQRKPGVRRLRHLRTSGLHCMPPRAA